MQSITFQANPKEIWVNPAGLTTRQQTYFDEQFGAFYRIEQAFFIAKNGEDMISKKYLKKVLKVQLEVQNKLASNGVGLRDLCFKPIRKLNGTWDASQRYGCMVETPLAYWKSDLALLEADPTIAFTAACQNFDLKRVQCMDSVGVPVIREVVLGGITCNEALQAPDPCGSCIPSAKALVLTFLLRNNPVTNANASLWEKDVFLETMASAAATLPNSGDGAEMSVSYMAQRSIEDAMGVEEHNNAWVVAISYLMMFLYISVTLGKFPHPVASRFLLGICGIVIVLCALAIALGVVSFFGVQTTFLVVEVAPFLVLAIGVDNMYIILKAFDKQPLQHATDLRMANALAEVGPSITAAAGCEFLAFAVGAATKIPALTSFCFVAALAVFADYVLQITFFVSAVVLDSRRTAAGRADCMPCITVIRGPDAREEGEGESKASEARSGSLYEVATGMAKPRAASADGTVELTFAQEALQAEEEGGGFWGGVLQGNHVKAAMGKYYAPLLLNNPIIKLLVILVTVALLVMGVYGAGHLELGLQQKASLPETFYLQEYFTDLAQYGDAGPPAYVVLRDVDYYSMAQGMDSAHMASPNISTLQDGVSRLTEYVQAPVYSWVQGFAAFRGGSGAAGCPLQPPELTRENFYPLVRTYLNIPIESPCCQSHGFCGAQYQQDIEQRFFTAVCPGPDCVIRASKLRTQHTALRTQRDFINAMYYLEEYVSAYSVNLTQFPGSNPDVDGVKTAFPYSLFYIYFEQYLTIQGVAIENTLIALGAVWLAAVFVTNISTSFFVVLIVGLITVDVIGLMWLWNVLAGGPEITQLNAVFVVNAVTAVGLSVEFAVHICSAFLYCPGSRKERALHALSEMGSSVLMGITCTKFCGVVVLAFAPSHLFRLYYFRMYMGIIIMGAWHGLVFLPVILSICGPQYYYADGGAGKGQWESSSGTLSQSLLAGAADEHSINSNADTDGSAGYVAKV